MVVSIFMQLIGGLGLFLYGMQLMASGMQKAAGDRMRKILELLTAKPIIAVFTGIVATVLVQSSSTTTVMLVGFVNAGLMTLYQTAGIIFGANIGTTFTGQLLAFDVKALIYPAIGLGAVLNFFGRRRTYRYLGQAVLGFGVLFLGMSTMSAAMEPARELPFFINMIATFGDKPLLGVLIGAAFTGMIQASGATLALVIAMTLQEIITLPAAIAIILGSNIGTCVTAMIASIGTSLSARRVAVAHLLFNVAGVVIALIFFNPFISLITATASGITRQTANAHTIFNVANTLLFLPFTKQYVDLITRLVPGDDITLEAGPKYLDKRMLLTPDVAIGGVRQELLRMARLAREMVNEAVKVFTGDDAKLIQQVLQKEELLDSLEQEITLYLADLTQHSLTKKQSNEISALMHAVNDLERIGDHAENITCLAEDKIENRLPLSAQAVIQLQEMAVMVDEMLGLAVEAFEKHDYVLAGQVVDREDEVDNTERILRKAHINRINDQICFPPSGIIFLDVISNLERIADHTTNFAQIVLGEF
jgi:phosphate:Na+ symporter